MSWVTDQRAEDLKGLALSALGSALDSDAFAQQKVRTVVNATAVAMGTGHAEGDRLVHDSVQLADSLERAMSRMRRAMDEARLIDTSRWEPDD